VAKGRTETPERLTVQSEVVLCMPAGWGLRKWTRLAEWLRDVVVLPYDVQVSYTRGRLAGAAQRQGRSRQFNDMWIAAVGLANGLPLATRNVKDYEDFVEHHGLRLITS
jgi:predicted nucleic acid-binding protein